MIRQAQPWAGNTKKRLVKSPKIYLRDTGLLHRLLNISDFEMLLGNPLVGYSWEGFIIENIIGTLSDKWRYSYYRTTTQTEIDLIIEGPRGEVWAIEVKCSTAPKIKAPFHTACADVNATKKFVVYSGAERFPIAKNTEAIGIVEFLRLIKEPDYQEASKSP
jgi:predicted AAA+ superfamily ATPase